MSYKKQLAALMLTTALLTAPVLAFAHEHGGKGGHEKPMECKSAHLTEAQKELFHQTMLKVHEENQQAHEDMHKLREQMHAAMKAQPFDKPAFLALKSQIDAKRAQLEQNRAEAFASIADKYTPEQRACLMHKIEHHKGMHHGMHEGMHEGWGHEHHAEWHHGEAMMYSSSQQQSPTTLGQSHSDGYPPYTQH